jgi:DNA-directed RNA polymerase subunit E'/Rpb7
MKHKITALLLIILIALAFTGCNRQLIDTTFKYDYVMFSMPDGEIIEGQVESWRDFTDGDQIQVKVNDDVYLVHSSDIVLRKTGEK